MDLFARIRVCERCIRMRQHIQDEVTTLLWQELEELRAELRAATPRCFFLQDA